MPLVAGERLLRLFPHRARNVLIDRADVPLEPGSRAGTGWLAIAPADPHRRDLLLYRAGDSLYMLSPFAAEYIALTSICVLAPELPDGKTCFFSTISAVEFSGRVPAGTLLRADVARHKDRGPFRRFSGHIVVDATGRFVCSADIMAYVLDMSEAAGQQPKAGKRLENLKTTARRPLPAGRFQWKQPAMLFASDICQSARTSLTTRYVYPADHPFCEGHFPGNPVMMGVAQWQMAEDALCCLAAELGAAGALTASAAIARHTGEIVAELKGLCVDFSVPAPATQSLERIAFRGIVRPGDELFCRVTLEQAQ